MSLLHRERKILDVAERAGNFTSLVTAIKLAGMERELSGAGPFTVFAPTDEAFKKVPTATMDGLIENKDKLVEVLRYHVIEAKFMAGDAVTRKEERTMQGGFLNFDTCDGLKVNNAKVLDQDIECRNGVIHVIDTVLMP